MKEGLKNSHLEEAPMPIFVTFASPNMGAIFGKGQVYGMNQGLKTLTPGNLSYAVTQYDPASGSLVGRRMHDPITIRKEVDSASPLILSALANNKEFPKFDLNFLKTNAHGKTEPYFTFTLTNAAVAGYGRRLLPHNHSTGRQHFVTNELEEIKLTFQEIVYTWIKGGISSSDDWNVRV
jgi:type VI secretion system Hcp family effector